MGCMCKKCSGMCGWTILILGILFLLADLGKISLFGINWWTVVFILVGLGKVASNKCSDCQTCSVPATTKKKR